MNKKLLISIIAILILGLGSVGYYLNKTKMPFKEQITNQITQNPATDIDSIKQAVAQKYGIPLNQMRVTFDQNPDAYNGLYAAGQVGSASGAGGGAGWYAAKVNGVWVIVAITQASLSCDIVNQYNLPKKMISDCLDSSGNLVSRISNTPTIAQPSVSPDVIVQSYYNSYFACAKEFFNNAYNGKGNKNQTVEQACLLLNKSDAFTLAFATKLTNAKAGDAVFCAQNIPQSISFDSAVITNTHATAVVHTIWGSSAKQNITVGLDIQNGTWEISSITCPH